MTVTSPSVSRVAQQLWWSVWSSVSIVAIAGGSSAAWAMALSSGIDDHQLPTTMVQEWPAPEWHLIQGESTTSGLLQFTPMPSRSEYHAASTLMFVNPLLGNDGGGDGSQRSPFRSLTYALSQAEVGTVIILAPGTYSVTNGEQFPIQLKPGVTVQGDPGSRGRGIEIRGGGGFISPTFARQDVAVLGANQATLTGVTITNPNGRGYGLWLESTSPTVMQNTFRNNTHDGISITGNSSATIEGNQFHDNGANGITIYGTSQPIVQGNVFENTGFGINIGQQATPQLMDNRIWQNRSGVVVQGEARPILRRNVIEYNEQDGLVAIAQSLPDLGSNTEPGQNRFSDNGQSDINAEVAVHPIIAVGNTLNLNHTIGQVHLTGSAASLVTTAPPVTTAPLVTITPPVTIPPAPEQSVISPQATSSRLSQESQRVAPSDIEAPLPQTTNSTVASETHGAVDRAMEETREIEPQRLPISNVQPQSPEALLGSSNSRSLERPLEHSLAVLPTGSDPGPSVTQPELEPDLAATEPEGNGGSSGGDRSILSLLAPSPSPSPLPSTPSSLLSDSISNDADDYTIDQDTNGVSIPVLFPDPSATNSLPEPDLSQPVAPRALSLPSALPTPTSSVSTPSVSSVSSALSPVLPSISIAASPDTRTTSPTRPPAPSVPPSHLLPVPGMRIPEGHLGSLSTISVQDDGVSSALLSSIPNLPTTGAIGRSSRSRYRVLVAADTDADQAFVSSLIPDAFLTYIDGRAMMQVGAYRQLENANEIAYQFVNHGLQVEVQRMN